MAEIFKFVYKWILFVSLFLVIVAKEDDIGRFILIQFALINFFFFDNALINLIYNLSFFHNISLLLLYITIECVTDADCYEKLPALQRAVMKCIQGFCKIHI